jgi:excisionase family DNA binding protein
LAKHIPTGPRAAYSVNETCALLGGTSRDWLYRQIREGRIISVKIGGRRFVSASEIERITAGGDA